MTALAWLCLAAILAAWFLTAASYRIDRAIERRAWERQFDLIENETELVTKDRDQWQTACRDAEAKMLKWRRRANDAETTAGRLRLRLLAQSARVFPAAPRSGEHLHVLVEGESPLYDALVGEGKSVASLAKKRAAKK